MRAYQGFLLSFIFLFVGCGSSGGGSANTAQLGGGGNQTVGTASIVVNQSITARAAPANIDNVRITGFKFAIIQGVLDSTGGGETFAPRNFPLSTSYRIENVPANTTAIRIEYLDAGQVVGLYVEDELSLIDGQVYEINDPAFTSAPEGVESFGLFAGFFPPGIGVSIPIADFPFQSGGILPISPEIPDTETAIFDGFGGLELSESMLAFTLFSSSDPSTIEVSNSGLFNSSYRSGSLWGKKPGVATITANFFGIEDSITITVANIRETEPTRHVHQGGFSPEDAATRTRIQAIGTHFDPGANIFDDQVDFTSELEYRPSDKPNVAQWDTTPGREGYIVRGSEAGRVILWARLPDNPLNWLAYPVENVLE